MIYINYVSWPLLLHCRFLDSDMTEKEYLANYNIHDFDVPLTSVDMSIFSVIDDALHVLLVKRGEFPSKGKWALPGGFIDFSKDKTLDDTAKRKLQEKTGVKAPYLEQVQTFGSKGRDPRGWSVTIAYFALITYDEVNLQALDKSSESVKWVPLERIFDQYKLAFDHTEILKVCRDRLRSKVQYTSLPVNLLPEEFTLTQLQKTFEIILGSSVEKKSFRRRVLDANILEETGNIKTGNNRPAKLYKAKPKGDSYFFPRNIEGAR